MQAEHTPDSGTPMTQESPATDNVVGVSTPPITARRTHKKSRTGCLQCKARKVKCDEHKPVCRNCIRHGVPCVFKTPTLSARARTPSDGSVSSDRNRTQPTGSANTARSETVPAPRAGPSEMNMTELELLHNYSTSTASTLSKHPIMQTVWRITVPQYGFANVFVMRAILAISAFHVAYFRPGQKAFYIAEGTHQHDTALRIVSGILPDITAENCSALYIFAALTTIIASARPRRPGDFLLVADNGVSQWVRMFRGIRAILDSAADTIRCGPLGPMFTVGMRKVRLRDTSAGPGPDQLQVLHRLMRETVPDPAVLQVYLAAIAELDKSFAAVAAQAPHDIEATDVFVWLFAVSEDYLALLAQRTQEALAILAFFCVVLRELESNWWMGGWSIHIISGVYHSLDQEHRLWIQWPMEQVGWIP